MYEYLLYPILGIFSGTLSGLFGIGGGLVIVPVLLLSFKLLGFDPDQSVYMSIGTSLSIISVTVSSATYNHHKRIGIDFVVFKKLVFPIIIGALTGAFFATALPAKALKILFAIFVTLVSLKMLFFKAVLGGEKTTSSSLYRFVGFIIGAKSSLLGIGGGTISIPFLMWRGMRIQKAIAISAALGIPISLSGGITYFIRGLSIETLPKYSLGYIYLPALIGVSLTSLFSTKLGVYLSHRLPQEKLRKIFACFLIIVAIRTILKMY